MKNIFSNLNNINFFLYNIGYYIKKLYNMFKFSISVVKISIWDLLNPKSNPREKSQKEVFGVMSVCVHRYVINYKLHFSAPNIMKYGSKILIYYTFRLTFCHFLNFLFFRVIQQKNPKP